MALKVGDRQQMIYQVTDHGPFWMVDDEERCLSILSLWLWWVGSAIICYFYHFSYLYMPLYWFYAFSAEFMFESKPARSDFWRKYCEIKRNKIRYLF